MGWEETTWEGMIKNGYQTVMDKLKHIKKDSGYGNDMDHYNSHRCQGKLEFALQLNVGNSATFMTATEQYGNNVTQSALRVEGCAT